MYIIVQTLHKSKICYEKFAYFLLLSIMPCSFLLSNYHTMKHSLPPLPYAKNALVPYISEETLEYHYGKHHQTYVDNLNQLINGTDFENLPLEEIVKTAPVWPIFNNAAQIWNHTFYFECFSPTHASPHWELMSRIERDFGSLEILQESFNKSAIWNFGSGWTWLALNNKDTLEIVNTSNAWCLLTHKTLRPLLVCDVWEHAYYIDTRNSRPNYLANFWKIVDCDKIASRLNG